MLKTIALLFSMIFISQAQASQCLDTVYTNRGLPVLTENQKKCLAHEADAPAAMQAVCKTTDQTSETYNVFRRYESTYIAAWMRFQTQKNPELAQAAADQMLLIDRDWSLFGKKDEVAAYLNTLASAHYAVRHGCAQ